MKKLLIGVLALTFAIPSFADCTNAYELKAKRRAIVNKNFTKAGIVASGAAVVGGGIVGMAAVGGLAWISLPVLAGLTGSAAAEYGADVRVTKDNTFYKSLASIEGAKNDVVPLELLEKLDRKINYNSLNEAQQVDVKKQIIQIILQGNESQELCMKNGREKPLNFKKLSQYVETRLN